MEVLLIGLAVFKITDLLKQGLLAYDVVLEPVVKSVITVLFALTLAWLWEHQARYVVVMGLASAGVSAVIHEFATLLSRVSDEATQRVMLRGVRRR